MTPIRRFVLDLSERLGMTAGELGLRMSGLELRERMVLETVRQAEHEKAMKKARRK